MTENEKIFKLQDVVVALVSVSEDIVSKEEFERIDNLGVEIINCLDELKRWRTNRINENIKNPFANMSTSICHNCDHKDEYIEDLESEVEAYQAIGTVEELQKLKGVITDFPLDCGSPIKSIAEIWNQLKKYLAIGTIECFRDLKEKNEPKKVAYQGEHEKCPTCGSFCVLGRYCSECGQKIDWGNEYDD